MKRTYKRMGSLCLVALMLISMLLVTSCNMSQTTNGTTTPAQNNDGTTTPGNGNAGDDNPNDVPSNPDGNKPDPEPITYTYTVQFLDPDSNPVQGINVQLCNASTCFPKRYTSDENGIATITRSAEDSGYKVTLISGIPEGMVALDADGNVAEYGVTYFYFDANKTVTVNLAFEAAAN